MIVSDRSVPLWVMGTSPSYLSALIVCPQQQQFSAQTANVDAIASSPTVMLIVTSAPIFNSGA